MGLAEGPPPVPRAALLELASAGCQAAPSCAGGVAAAGPPVVLLLLQPRLAASPPPHPRIHPTLGLLSLYPSLYRAHNLCYTTLVHPGARPRAPRPPSCPPPAAAAWRGGPWGPAHWTAPPTTSHGLGCPQAPTPRAPLGPKPPDDIATVGRDNIPRTPTGAAFVKPSVLGGVLPDILAALMTARCALGLDLGVHYGFAWETPTP